MAMNGPKSLTMVSHAPDVDLATRLGRIMDILDVIVPEAEEHYSTRRVSIRQRSPWSTSLETTSLRRSPSWATR